MALFSHEDLMQVGAVLRAAAGQQIMPRFRRLDAGDVRLKTSVHDLVTEADIAAERQITDDLQRRFPGCAVVGEEAVSTERAVLNRIGEADLVFVVDPVDGTKNFASGLPLFGTMAAVVAKGEVVAGAIHDPVLGDTAYALRGEGAWIEGMDGTRQDLKVAAPVAVADMNGLVSWAKMPEPARSTVARNLTRFAATNSYRCAAHEYRFLAAGHADFAVAAQLMPWDHAAGWLMHKEAGGYAARFDGSAYLPTHLDGGLLLAADKPSWEAIHAALFSA